MPYDVGTQVRFQCTFKNLAGTATDPTSITVKIKDPSGNVQTLVYGVDSDVKKGATAGIYYVDRTIDESGIWRHRWAGTGTVEAANEASIRVEKQHVL